MQRVFRSIFWLAVAATLFFALRPVVITIPTSDKTQHAVTFAVLAFLAGVAFPQARLWALGFALSGFGALIEILQPWFGRDDDARDWIADTIGLAIAFALVWIVRRVLRERPTPYSDRIDQSRGA